VAVGADYNLLLVMRLKEEAHAGLKTAVIRAFGGTGGVVTTAGIVFGITMFAMLGGNVLSIAQVGSTIGVGLLIDTLVVRAFVVPSIVVLLGRWFWWSPRVSAFVVGGGPPASKLIGASGDSTSWRSYRATVPPSHRLRFGGRRRTSVSLRAHDDRVIDDHGLRLQRSHPEDVSLSVVDHGHTFRKPRPLSGF
jgi:MMPL family